MKKLSNFQTRLIASAVMAVILFAIFLTRLWTVYVVDVVVLFFVFVAIFETHHLRKLDTRGVKSLSLYLWVVCAYFFYILGEEILTEKFTVWLHIGLQLGLLAIFALYSYFMALVDKKFEKECQVAKKSHKKESLLASLDFLNSALYPSLLLLMLIPINHIKTVGFMGILLVFIVSCFTDMFAYAFGLTIRGPKLCPKLSPKKSWSGFGGGVIGGIIASLLVLWMVLKFKLYNVVDDTTFSMADHLYDKLGNHTATTLWFVLFGAIGAVVATAGDLFASYIKRKAEVKDFGKYIPGHGGAMDRLDGISFNAVYFLIIAFCLA
ncbi:MAG: phosphatidate cytidylyltransferase [Christensenellaceae bacterium]|jgi:CDP-diglyceride synthetase|nr:phosphatidate cytidylyltransferase [Christensenellaceae bacterium]